MVIAQTMAQSYRKRESIKDLKINLNKIKTLAKKQRKQIQRMSILFDTEEFNRWIGDCFIELNEAAGLPEMISDE